VVDGAGTLFPAAVGPVLGTARCGFWGLIGPLSCGMAMETYRAGQRVRVTQQVPHLGNGDATLCSSVEGVVVGFSQEKTGSWYAHSKDHKLWIDRLQVRKDDGELVYVNLDQYSSVEVIG
jgi:hypothetical protein